MADGGRQRETDRAVPFIFRMALPKNAGHRAACGAPERGKGTKLSAKRAGVGVGGMSQPQGVWEPPPGGF